MVLKYQASRIAPDKAKDTEGIFDQVQTGGEADEYL